MDPRSESGFSLAELLVSVALLGVILGGTALAADVVRRGDRVTSRQARFAREIGAPLHTIDKVLSDNKAIETTNGWVSDPYTITVRSPVDPVTRTYTRHVFSAGTDGRFIETVYECPEGSATGPVRNTTVWSTANKNRVRGPVFTYLGASGETTAPAGARSVVVELFTEDTGRTLSGKRQVYFRNR